MSELVERVAKAIALSLGEHAHWMEHVVDARAAIEVMREPTETMITAGFGPMAIGDGVSEVWRSMIDEALK